jgi:hypothetical protein
MEVAMGEVWTPGTVTLQWSEDHYLHGLVIVMKRQALEATLSSWEAEGRAANGAKWSDLDPPVRAKQIRRTTEELAELIVSWTGPDAPTAANLLRVLELQDVSDIWEKYREATARVSPPLPTSSADGSDSAAEELQLPMEPLSN